MNQPTFTHLGWRVPFYNSTIYAFALIDRVNLPNARIAGMDEDLELSIGARYSLIVMIFFVSHVY